MTWTPKLTSTPTLVVMGTGAGQHSGSDGGGRGRGSGGGGDDDSGGSGGGGGGGGGGSDSNADIIDLTKGSKASNKEIAAAVDKVMLNDESVHRLLLGDPSLATIRDAVGKSLVAAGHTSFRSNAQVRGERECCLCGYCWETVWCQVEVALLSQTRC